MFVVGKQIKKNKIRRALQMIYFYFFLYDGDMMIMCFFLLLINHFTL
jgi:hypothetical protein